MARAVPEEELRSALEGMLPGAELATLAPRGILDTAADVLDRYSDVL